MEHDVAMLTPEVCLLVGTVTCLLMGSFLARERQRWSRVVAVLALVAAAVTALVGPASPAMGSLAFQASYALDAPTTTARMLICAATLLVLLLGRDELAGDPRESEICSLLLAAALGAVVLAGASDLLVLAVAYLLASIPLYALVGLARTPAAAEAALKTYLLGALLGIVMLLGVVVLVALAGGSTYAELVSGLRSGQVPRPLVAVGVVATLGGLLFKAGAVPGHFWVPDTAQGARTALAAFATTVPKIGGLIAAYRLVDATVQSGAVQTGTVVAGIAAATALLGVLAAFGQDDVRRLLGWSTVSQAGFLLFPVAAAGRSDLAQPSLLLYLAGYAAANLAAFAVVAAEPHRRTREAWRGAARRRPWVGAALLVSLLGLVGTPPTAVFVGKLTTFTAAWDGGLAWLVVLGAVATAASLFPYLRWLAAAFAKAPADEDAGQVSRGPSSAAAAAVSAAAVVLVLGVGAGPLWTAVSGQVLR